MNGNTDNARFTCDNWDPEVKIRRNGRKFSDVKRKVVTRGIVHVRAARILEGIVKNLRKGYEVRLTDGSENDAIRIFPIASTDCRRMYVRTQAMGELCDVLKDKQIVVTHGGEQLSQGETVQMIDEQQAKHERYEEDTKLSVVPDLMVTCPNCGTEFRVGRSSKE